jgi:hypothetical protein
LNFCFIFSCPTLYSIFQNLFGENAVKKWTCQKEDSMEGAKRSKTPIKLIIYEQLKSLQMCKTVSLYSIYLLDISCPVMWCVGLHCLLHKSWGKSRPKHEHNCSASYFVGYFPVVFDPVPFLFPFFFIIIHLLGFFSFSGPKIWLSILPVGSALFLS